ncbi:MAG: cation:proton antiporter [Verrucomicrobiota bacterium]
MKHDIINDMTVCIVAAWILAVCAKLTRQPLILAYLIAGFTAGPLGIGLVKERDSIESLSGLGLILLLFMIGLEIDLKKILSAGRIITITSATQILGGCLLGVLYFWSQGFQLANGQLDALYLAIAAALSSTVISVKILYDKRELDTLVGRITLGVLVLQDLFAVLFLSLQSNLRDPAVGLLFQSLFRAILLVAAAFTVSKYVLPSIFKAVARLPELVLVGALAWCFTVAAAAGKMGLSREMGALIAGVAISTFPYTLDVTAKVTSLRDFFVTLFFVSLGMSIPAPSGRLLEFSFIFAVFVILSRILTVFLPLHWMRQGHRTSLLPAINLSQVSEFSIVILALGSKAGHLSDETKGIVAYGFVFLAIASTYAMVKSESILRWLSPRINKLGLPDLDRDSAFVTRIAAKPTIFLLGFSWTASSLLEEIARTAPDLHRQLAVIDFNPHVNEELRKRGIPTIYGDISHRETLMHAGIDAAEIIICSLPDAVLKGTNNLRLLREVRELNPHAKILMQADLLTDVPRLYKAGANYVSVSRLIEARELCAVVQAARENLLDEKRDELDRLLAERREVIP